MRITLNSKDGNDTLIVIDSDSITIKKDGKTKTYKGIEAAKRIDDQNRCIQGLRRELRETVEFNEEQARERMGWRLRDFRSLAILVPLAMTNPQIHYLVDDLVKIARESTQINEHYEDEEEWDDDE